MGKKIDALLGRSFKASKFKATVNLAISRLAVLKNQRQARCSIARSDVVQLLNLGHHERALLRVEQVIKEQNMLDALALIEDYCNLLIERVNLIEQEKTCPDELKEAISSLIYAATRCGNFPELQEMRAVFVSRFGKEFVARATELRNNCGVNPKIIQMLSTRTPSLENRLKVLKEIASEKSIILQIEEDSSVATEQERLEADQKQKQKQNQPKPDSSANPSDTKQEGTLPILPEDIGRVEDCSDQMKAKQKYRDVADAAQAAFESAAYAAAAARVAVELSRSGHDPDTQNGPAVQPRKEHDAHESAKAKLHTDREPDTSRNGDLNVGMVFEKIHPIQTLHSESEGEEMHVEHKAEVSKQSKNAAELNRSLSSSSSDSADNMLKGNILSSEIESWTKPMESEIVFDESDDENRNEGSDVPLSRTNHWGFQRKQHSVPTNDIVGVEQSSAFKDKDLPGGSSAKLYHQSYKQYRMRPQAGPMMDSLVGNLKVNSAERSRTEGPPHLDLEKRPISVRTRRGHEH